MSTTRRYTYAPRRSPGLTRTEGLRLVWEAEGSSHPHDENMHGKAAWNFWVGRYGAAEVPIYWSVAPAWEHAPFQDDHGVPFHGDFLTYSTWPKDARGRRLRWTDLPVTDGKSAWIYELTGWRPAAFTPTMPVAVLARACGLTAPAAVQV